MTEENHEERIARYTKFNEDIRQQDQKERAYDIAGTRPDVFLALIPKETQFTTMIGQLHQFDAHPEESHDLHVDLTNLANPVGHFVGMMQAESLELLRIVNSQKVQVEVML